MYLNQIFVINSFEFFFSTLLPSHVQHLLKKEEYKQKNYQKNSWNKKKGRARQRLYHIVTSGGLGFSRGLE